MIVKNKSIGLIDSVNNYKHKQIIVGIIFRDIMYTYLFLRRFKSEKGHWTIWEKPVLAVLKSSLTSSFV